MGPVVLRAGARRALAIFAAIAAVFAAAALAPPASAQFDLPGCDAAKTGKLDGLYGLQPALHFDQDERLIVSAHVPTKGPQPDSISLQIDGFPFATVPFPGVIIFDPRAAPGHGYTASWFVSSGGQQDTEATWRVDCQLVTFSPPPTPTSKKQCKHGGWKSFDTMFKNQGDCVSFVATGGKNRPSGG